MGLSVSPQGTQDNHPKMAKKFSVNDVLGSGRGDANGDDNEDETHYGVGGSGKGGGRSTPALFSGVNIEVLCWVTAFLPGVLGPAISRSWDGARPSGKRLAVRELCQRTSTELRWNAETLAMTFASRSSSGKLHPVRRTFR